MNRFATRTAVTAAALVGAVAAPFAAYAATASTPAPTAAAARAASVHVGTVRTVPVVGDLSARVSGQADGTFRAVLVNSLGSVFATLDAEHPVAVLDDGLSVSLNPATGRVAPHVDAAITAALRSHDAATVHRHKAPRHKPAHRKAPHRKAPHHKHPHAVAGHHTSTRH